MNPIRYLLLITLISGFIFPRALFSQEQTRISVKIEKNGRVVKDTTYLFDNDKEAERAIKFMDLMARDDDSHLFIFDEDDMDEEMMKEGRKVESRVWVTNEGERHEITHMNGDSLVWITEKIEENDNGKTVKKTIKVGKQEVEGTGSQVIIVKSGNEGDDDMRVLVKDEENGKGTPDEEGEVEIEKNVVVVHGDKSKEELEKLLNEDDTDKEVKVIVIKTKKSNKENNKEE